MPKVQVAVVESIDQEHTQIISNYVLKNSDKSVVGLEKKISKPILRAEERDTEEEYQQSLAQSITNTVGVSSLARGKLLSGYGVYGFKVNEKIEEMIKDSKTYFNDVGEECFGNGCKEFALGVKGSDEIFFGKVTYG